MDKTVGILGGGQLGRMLTEAANRLNVKVVILDAEGSPAKQISATQHVDGSFKDPKSIRLLAQSCDVLTVEIEHVDTDVLEELASGEQIDDNWRRRKGTKVETQPNWHTIRTIQDKYAQKEHLREQGIATASSIPIEQNSVQELKSAAKELGFPFMLKSRTEAYDGRGNYPVEDESKFQAALHVLRNRPLYAEKWANFRMELAVMVVKTEEDGKEDWEGSTLAFPVVETVHEESICKLVYAPARGISDSVMQQARGLAQSAVATFRGKGVFGVEMFLLEDGELLINEIAPRPHNSGHYTIEACKISQYDAHLRAILGLPIRQESLELRGRGVHAVMLNILGGATPDSHQRAVGEILRINPEASIHLYGKGDARPGRKMGHVTILANSMTEAGNDIDPLIKIVDKIRNERTSVSEAVNSETPKEASEKDSGPGVAVTMGSDSDLRVLKPGLELLKELGIPYFLTITSAHRTPERMFRFAKEAELAGFKVIIAAAGGAAHLPGMIAASTILPVIGVPVKTSNLEGLDSLLSIVQMPRGCPVATVAVNNSDNAALLAARILALNNVDIQTRLKGYLNAQTRTVEEKADKLEKLGFEEYDLQS